MTNLKINTTSNSYEVFISENSLNEISNFTDKYDKILLFSNDTVGNLYKDKVLSALPIEKTMYFQIKDGEEFKNMDSAMEVYSFLLKNNYTRNSLIICLGGGVVCDLGGFIASTFMRGIDFLQIPTTLLSQVDASIGGKVAINHPLGKNMIGAFKQPIAVIINTDFLNTLPLPEFKSGLGEVIKHSLLSENKEYFDFLKNNSEEIINLVPETIEKVILESCKIKKIYVESDELEKGDRALLNLGHTYGHSLETLFQYKNISHGNSVAKGVIFELYLSKHLGYIGQEKIDEAIQLFDLFKINSTPVYVEETTLLSLMKNDKKNSQDNINFIIYNGSSWEKMSINKSDILAVNCLFKNNFIKATIDIGTNSCRLFIAQVKKLNGTIEIVTPLFKDLDISRLGKNLNQSGILCKESIDKTFSILKNFKRKCEDMGVTEIIAFATSATREASNGNQFVQAIKEQFGINTLVIPGEVEAKLSFNGNSNIYLNTICTIDVGGGSTEITIGDSNSINYVKSFPIGVVKLTEMFFKDENYSIEAISSAKNYLKGFFKELNRFHEDNFMIIGVAGTVTTNVSIIKEMEKFIESEIDGHQLNYDDLNDNLHLFLSKTLEERKEIVGLEANRADVIISGNLILLTLLDLLNKNTITVSTKDNLEGGMVLNI